MSRKKTRHSAKDGKFVSKEFAESNPDEVVEVTNHDNRTELELTTVLSKYIQYIRAVEGSDYILDIDERKLSGIGFTDEEWSTLTEIATAGQSKTGEN